MHNTPVYLAATRGIISSVIGIVNGGYFKNTCLVSNPGSAIYDLCGTWARYLIPQNTSLKWGLENLTHDVL